MSKKSDVSLRKTEDALKIVARYGKIRPKVFAREMWPDSDGWQRQSKCGERGMTKGGGMATAAGCFLGTLKRRGLLDKLNKTYLLTEEGIDFLVSAEEYFANKEAAVAPVAVAPESPVTPSVNIGESKNET